MGTTSARVDQPWRRESFRHPDLMGWVRANRGKLVAACLTLCQAWVAAGRPRGSRSIGSFENWAQIISGVLDVAGVNGFLGNLDEMMEASDSEGAVWRSFVETWWGRFGTAEVTTASLYELAFLVEPPLPINAPDEQGRRVKLGKALSKLRDRTFRLATHAVQVKALGVRQQAQRWGLVLSQEKDTPQAHLSTAEPVKSGRIGRIAGGLSGHPPTQNHPSNQYVREDGEDREDVSHPYEGVPVGTIKRFATGKGNADKAAIIAAMKARGFNPADDNEADALALLLWATSAQGGQA